MSDALKKHTRIVSVILAILFGGYGIHKFYTGRTMAGFVMLLGTGFGLFSAALPFVMGVIGIVEGIKYFLMEDEEFFNTYMVEQKQWF